jgi:hypothetical protein
MESLAGSDAVPRLFPLIDTLRKRDSLQWFAELGLGYYPVQMRPVDVYNEAYFAKYQGYAETELGKRLNDIRIKFVRRFYDGNVVDVGVGCGSFVRAIGGGSRGYDISPTAVRWLIGEDLFRDPYKHGAEAVTFWDSMEHIEDFSALLDHVTRYVFVSVPIFKSLDHVLRSKHYRKIEHCWYFTSNGLVRLMSRLGWELIGANDDESRAGREHIGSFAFQKE